MCQCPLIFECSPFKAIAKLIINQVALTKNYAFVFDKAAGTTMLYCSDKNDISDEILDEIGNVMQTVRREDRKKN
jgi:hypothetical protein